MAAGVRELNERDTRCVRAAVLGSPVGHSLSPALHTAAYAALGLTWWRYDAVECDEAALPGLLDRCGPEWAGLSLTMPLKRAVLPLLDRADPLVGEVGGANTVLFAAEQRIGYNTDLPGMDSALAERGITAGPQADIRPALILGAGATACAALAALRDLGEREVAVAVRDPGRAGDLLASAGRLSMTITLRPFEAASLAGARLIISAVPAGAADTLATALPELPVPPHALLEVVYDPWPTRLAQAANAAGAVLAGGFDLLLHQAALQVELMTGRPAPVEEMRRAGQAALSRRLPAVACVAWPAPGRSGCMTAGPIPKSRMRPGLRTGQPTAEGARRGAACRHRTAVHNRHHRRATRPAASATGKQGGASRR